MHRKGGEFGNTSLVQKIRASSLSTESDSRSTFRIRRDPCEGNYPKKKGKGSGRLNRGAIGKTITARTLGFFLSETGSNGKNFGELELIQKSRICAKTANLRSKSLSKVIDYYKERIFLTGIFSKMGRRQGKIPFGSLPPISFLKTVGERLEGGSMELRKWPSSGRRTES